MKPAIKITVKSRSQQKQAEVVVFDGVKSLGLFKKQFKSLSIHDEYLEDGVTVEDMEIAQDSATQKHSLVLTGECWKKQDKIFLSIEIEGESRGEVGETALAICRHAYSDCDPYVTDTQVKKSRYRVSGKHPVTKEKEWAQKAFKAVTLKEAGNLCGNVHVTFNKAGIAKLGEYDAQPISGYQQISSALALYRCISLFEIQTIDNSNSDFYKMNWMITLQHKATGECLGLGEWKGSFGIFTRGRNVDELPVEFVKACERFLTLFVSENLTIGYDGCKAGQCA